MHYFQAKIIKNKLCYYMRSHYMYLVEVFLLEEHDGLVNLKVVCEVNVLGVLHLVHTPAITTTT